MASKKIRSLLIANRGEIARRIVRTCKKLSINTTSIYATADQNSPLLHETDDAVWIGDSESSQSYLDIQKIIKAAKTANIDAIHPGYGFLSENPDFAQACIASNIIFIGPTPETITTVADKRAAKKIAISLGIPTAASLQLSAFSMEPVQSFAAQHGYPLLIKAAFGGGGRGMRIIESSDDIESLSKNASEEAKKFFSSPEIFIEQYIQEARHIEVQILGSVDGEVIALGTRDCSLQRNYQKVIEEAPAPKLSSQLETKLLEAAISIGKAVHYHGAGTVEFLVKNEEFYFLEVNSRIQVEHPVTEMIYKIDLIEAQIKIAEGISVKKLFPKAPRPKGHAIEARICAENPRKNFSSQTGYVSSIDYAPDKGETEENPQVRYDFAFDTHGEVSHFYDSLIGKVIAWAPTRDEAIYTLQKSLAELHIRGVLTNTEFLLSLLRNEKFHSVSISTELLGSLGTFEGSPNIDYALVAGAVLFQEWSRLPRQALKLNQDTHTEQTFRLLSLLPLTQVTGLLNEAPIAFGIQWKQKGTNTAHGIINKSPYSFQQETPHIIKVNTDKIDFSVEYHWSGKSIFAFCPYGAFTCELPFPRPLPFSQNSSQGNEVRSPLPGKVINIAVVAGQTVQANDLLCTIESMKMEHHIRSPFTGVVEEVLTEVHSSIAKDSLLLRLLPEKA